MKPKAKSSTAGATRVAQATNCAPVAESKPTFTRPSAGASRRYVASKSKTNPVTGIRSRDAESVGRKADTVTQTQGRVFVLGKGKEPLVIRLKHRTGSATQPVIIKLDPGARTTGVALVRAQR